MKQQKYYMIILIKKKNNKLQYIKKMKIKICQMIIKIC